jgi:hypothetical protein
MPDPLIRFELALIFLALCLMLLFLYIGLHTLIVDVRVVCEHYAGTGGCQ